jgi:hypothetical protein
VSDDLTVLFANEAFYVAFAECDLKAMDRVWSERTRVTCIHPGWPVLNDREQVMKSWQAILANPASPKIVCHRPMVRLLGDTAYVICYEAIGGGTLVATNIFTRENGAWRMVHHQAGTAPPLTGSGEQTPHRLQ